MGEQPSTASIGAAPDYGVPPGALVEAYRRGDPLRVIAADHSLGISRLSTAATVILNQRDELERHRAVRRRSATAAMVLQAQENLVGRLSASGIPRSDIPTVLEALGTQIDAAMATELLNVPSRFFGPRAEPRRAGDRLSLLFVAGTHHGIEPDYKLALGKMSLGAVAEIRNLLHPDVPYRHLADILAVIEPAALAIGTRRITTLAYGDYDETARRISRELGVITKDQADPWPVPATTMRHRYGRGFWDDTLASVGLALSSAEARFVEDDYFQALDDFTEECLDFDYTMDIETYDRWVAADSAGATDRPSAVQVVRHYGTWEAALGENPEPRGDSRYVSAGAALFEWKDPAAEAAWVRAAEFICELLANMPLNRSLQIQYGDQGDGSLQPYAQGTRNADGIWCEIVSEHFLPDGQWPIDTEYLERHDWLAPDDEMPQWCKEQVPFHDAGHQLLKGLRFGRLCPDPWQLRWSTRRRISGAGPDRGVTLQDALRGTVQTLQNAG